MMTGLEYIQQKRIEVRNLADAWKLRASGLSSRAEQVLEKTLKILNADQNFIDELIKAKKSDVKNVHPTVQYRLVLETLSDSIKDDLNIYTDNEYTEILQKTGVSILECGDIHAGCVRVNDYDEILDGYGIFINLGTYYSLQLLAKTIIIENFTNDFLRYKSKSTEFIDLASRIYILQDSRTTKEINFYEYPANLEAEASAAQSSVVIKVMQFIALHELGHIINNDLEIMGFHKRYMNTNIQSTTTFSSPSDIIASHKAEFEADLFALNALFDYDENETSTISKWSGFYPIFYFLAWLNALEIKHGKVTCDLHPNALTRAKKIYKRMLEITKNKHLNYDKELEKVEAYFQIWSKTVTEEFVIHTRDKGWLTGLFNKNPTKNSSIDIDENINVRFIQEKETGKAFGGSEVAITFAVSVVAGIASNVLADIIYDKLMNKGKRKIIVKEKKVTITTKNELLSYIETTYEEGDD